jgi:ribosomal protein S18 acetylase RimI-like enzyme
VSGSGFDFARHVRGCLQAGYVEDEHGYVVWRAGTGGNCELLHLKVREPGNGHGTRLLREMLLKLRADPPYATVYGFVLESNYSARLFYWKSGFALSAVEGVYADGKAFVFSQRYDRLCELHGIPPKEAG